MMQYIVNPKSDVTVQKTIPELINLMNGIFYHGKGTYTLMELNEAFNLYRISMLDGLFTVILTVQFQSIDSNNTKIHFEAMLPNGGGASQATLQSNMNGFMTILGKAINGEEITNEMVKSNSNHLGVIWTVVLVIIGAILIFTILRS